MKTAALLILASLLSPAALFVMLGARRESWPILTLAGAVLAGAVAGIHFLLT